MIRARILVIPKNLVTATKSPSGTSSVQVAECRESVVALDAYSILYAMPYDWNELVNDTADGHLPPVPNELKEAINTTSCRIVLSGGVTVVVLGQTYDAIIRDVERQKRGENPVPMTSH